MLNDPVNFVDPMGLWQFTFGGGLGAGIGLNLSLNPDDSDPNTPAASSNCNNGDADSIGLIAYGSVGVTDILSVTGGVSLMGKGDNMNTALSPNISGGASVMGLNGGGVITGDINIDNNGNITTSLFTKPDATINVGAFGFIGIGGGHTWK